MMVNLIKKMIIKKKEYKEQMIGVKELPEDYRFVFEESVSEGLHVLEVTGNDVAGFCDEFLQYTK